MIARLNYSKPKFSLLKRSFLALMFLAGVVSSFAVAEPPRGKGGGNGGGGGDGGNDVPPGLIYFVHGYEDCWSVLGDGSGLVPEQCYLPSHSAHGGQTWFVQPREIQGEFYPDGDPRIELFALNSDGTASVQLTDQVGLEVFAWGNTETKGIAWSRDDKKISWIGLQWSDTDGDGSLDRVINAGIYHALLTFSDDGAIEGVAGQPDPSTPLVTSAFYELSDGNADGVSDQSYPLVRAQSWSPDGKAIVYSEDGVITIADLEAGNSLPMDNGETPAWSSDGTRIAYTSDVGLAILSLATGELNHIVFHQNKGNSDRWALSPKWSPNSDWLIYDWYEVARKKTYDGSSSVHRIRADGTNDQDLTVDFNTAKPIAWR